MLAPKTLALFSSLALLAHSAPSELSKRDKCDEGCGDGYTQIKVGGCTWACIQNQKSPINLVPETGALAIAAATVISAVITAWSTYRGNRRVVQESPVRRGDDEYVQAFKSVVDRLSAVGGSGPGDMETPGDLGPQEVDYEALYAKWSDADHIITLNDTEVLVEYTGPQKRADGDHLTAYKVIYHNAKVDGCFQTHQFDEGEVQEFSRQIFQSYLDHANGGRSACACLRRGQGKGWAAALTIEGQANHNGKYDHIRCDCDWSPGLRGWFEGCP